METWTQRREAIRPLPVDWALGAAPASEGACLSESLESYGAPRVHAELRRRTTIAEPTAAPAPDLVRRRFTASRPNELWLADIIYLRTREGLAVSGGRPRRLQPAHRRLVDARRSQSRACRRRGCRWDAFALRRRDPTCDTRVRG
jgi:hypothetical protein